MKRRQRSVTVARGTSRRRAASVESREERQARREEDLFRRRREESSWNPIPGQCAKCKADLRLLFQPFRWVDAADPATVHACAKRVRPSAARRRTLSHDGRRRARR